MAFRWTAHCILNNIPEPLVAQMLVTIRHGFASEVASIRASKSPVFGSIEVSFIANAIKKRNTLKLVWERILKSNLLDSVFADPASTGGDVVIGVFACILRHIFTFYFEFQLVN